MNEAMASHAIGGRDMGGGGRDMGAMTAAMSETNLGEADGIYTIPHYTTL